MAPSLVRRPSSNSAAARPKLSKSASSSWVCETLDSRVFTPASHSSAAKREARREWVPQDAAGMRREDVSSAQHAQSTFFRPNRVHGQYAGDRQLMSDILYGRPTTADAADATRRRGHCLPPPPPRHSSAAASWPSPAPRAASTP